MRRDIACLPRIIGCIGVLIAALITVSCDEIPPDPFSNTKWSQDPRDGCTIRMDGYLMKTADEYLVVTHHGGKGMATGDNSFCVAVVAKNGTIIGGFAAAADAGDVCEHWGWLDATHMSIPMSGGVPRRFAYDGKITKGNFETFLTTRVDLSHSEGKARAALVRLGMVLDQTPQARPLRDWLVERWSPGIPLTHASRKLPLDGLTREDVVRIFGGVFESRVQDFEPLKYGVPVVPPETDRQLIYNGNMRHVLIYLHKNTVLLAVEEWSDY